MKKSLVIFFVFVTSNLFAQMSLINSGVTQTWKEILYTVGAEGQICENITTYSFGEKVTLEGIECTSVMKSIDDETSCVGYMYEIGQKCYFKLANSTEEYLIYDFSLNVTDEISIMYDNCWGTSNAEKREFITENQLDKRIVTSVDVYKDLQGTERKKIVLDNGEIWIEGVGSIHGLLHSCSVRSGVDIKLLSYLEDNKAVVEQECPCIRLDTKDVVSRNYSISPNPVKDFLQLTLPTDNNEIQIFDIQGKLVLQTECGETASIHVSMLPKGVYSLVVNNSESQTFIKQ